MATDAFTNTNGVFLTDHVAGGNTWEGCGQPVAAGEIQSNAACADASDSFSVSARATNSSVGYSQIVFKGGAYDDGVKRVHVRASAASQGYWISASISGGNIVGFALWHGDGTFLTTASVTPVSQASDQTVAIKATTNGANVEVRAFINGNPITWDDNAAGSGVPGTVYTNVAADTPAPIMSGNPGFTCDFFGTISAANSAFDNWTDVEGSVAAVLSSPTPSGAIGTATTATIGATTDQATGTFYVVVDTSGNLAGVTATQIKAGQNAGGGAAFKSGDVAVGSTTPSVGVTGLVASTSYAYAAIQNNANGDSNIVTGTFTTASGSATSRPGSGGARARVATLMLS
jgi:hypothetical protein